MPVALEIVTPEKLLLSRDVDMVVIPASEGDLAAQEGHAPMIVMLRGGAIRLYAGMQVTDTYFVASGFAEITAERCTVLAHDVIPAAEVSRTEAQSRLSAAETAYAEVDKTDPQAIELAMEGLQSAQAMLDMAAAA